MIKNHYYQWTTRFKKGMLFRSVALASMCVCFGVYGANANALENEGHFEKEIELQSTITGTVVDETGTPLPGASIVVKGTTNGTQTDFDGNFTIDADSNATLVVSYIGYATQEVAVNGQTTVNISLAEDANVLEEVVLVGYGTQSRASVTNAISSVSSEDLVQTPAVGVQQALQGRAAGVQVTNSGAPGSNPLVTIRGLGTFGNNQPLFVVDGVPTNSLNSIPPSSIESVEILKDASSAAIYGSRASNGVVLIKTKAGRSGKPRLSFTTFSGLSTNTKTLDVLNAREYIEYARTSYDADAGTPGRQLPQTLQPDVVNPAVDTDWQDAVLRTGLWQNYDLEASGGNENAKYSVRTGYLKQEGTTLQTDFERYTVGVNSTLNLSDKISVGQTMNLGLSTQNQQGSAGASSVLVNALRFDPTKPVFDNETNFFSEITTSVDGQDAENPVRILSNGSSVFATTQIVGSIFGSYEILPGLTYKLTVGLDLSHNEQDQFFKSIPTGSRQRLESETRKRRQKSLTTVITNTLNYNRTISEKHNIGILAGYERNKSNFNQVFGFTANSLTDVVENFNPGDVRDLSSFESENNLHSVFGRVDYDFDKTFLLSGSIRADGSSRFPTDRQWGYFPSASAGVNFANLPFLEGNELISALKLRGSWGITGNNNIGDYRFQTGLLTDFNYVIDGALVSGTRPARIPNELLQWEESTSLNLGIDLGFWNNALTASVDYFNNESDGLLLSVPLRSSLGATDANQIQNVGGTEFSGMEFNLGYRGSSGDFNWGANANATVNLSQEVTSLGPVEAVLQGNVLQQNVNRLFVGEAPLHFFGYRTDGIFQTNTEVAAHATQNGAEPGNVRFVDTNNDGVVNAEDRVVIGNPNPDFTLNFDVNLSYKNIDLSIIMNGVYGVDIYNGLRAQLEQQARLFNTTTAILNRWSPTNPSQTVPKATPGFTGNELTSDRFIEDGSYTRIRDITLGYSIPDDVLGKFVNGLVSNLRFYVSGQNLFTFTDYSGYDPEVAPTLQSGTTVGLNIDQGVYPQPRTILAGLQVQF